MAESDVEDAMYEVFVPLLLAVLASFTLIPGTVETMAALRARGSRLPAPPAMLTKCRQLWRKPWPSRAINRISPLDIVEDLNGGVWR
ncbi:MAG: hypothetical protein R2932_39505 [Caldilineaceae bacterium]